VGDSATTNLPAVRLQQVAKIFASGSVAAVDHVSFDVHEGELLVLLGPSGCGKTTTLRMIAGLEEPDDGQIWLGSRLVSDARKNHFLPTEKRHIGMVFQSYAIWPHMTVYGNVAYPLRMRRENRADVRAKVIETLSLVGLLGLQDRLATQLSGGQQQRTAIARAIVATPGLLLFDEPLSNLDAMLRAQMRVELRHLQRKLNITTIYVTHDQVEAMVLSDRVIVMYGGRIQQIGPPRDVYLQPRNRFVAEFIGFTNFIKGTVVARDESTCHVSAFTDGPVLRCQSKIHVDVGDEIMLATRANAVELFSNQPSDATNVMAGRAIEAIYLGDTSEYRIQAGPLTLVASRSERAAADEAAPRPIIGDSVWLRLSPASIVTLPTNEEA
jgi:iron(III) transport system ATP-binding protein